MRPVPIGLMLFLSSFAVSLLVHGDESSPDRKIPLDLPAGGGAQDDDDDDYPEPICFYGLTIEGDAFFWCLDKSGSMHGIHMTQLKQEVTRAVQSLSSQTELGLCAFSQNHVLWREQPQRATPSGKAAAVAWVQSLVAGGQTIIAPACVRTVGLSQESRKRVRTIIVVGDGEPQDASTAIHDITAVNHDRTPINTILVSDTGAGAGFMQALAAANRGEFSLVGP